MKNEYQKELFENFKKEKSKLEKIADKITRRQRRFSVNLPLENLVFLIIIVIMCIVLAFAQGVEYGKRRSAKATTKATAETTEKEVSKIIAEAEQKPTEVETDSKPYTIQLISYKKKSLAEKEQNKLLDRKINAFMIPSGGWFQVCAGYYGSVEEAKLALKDYSKEYKGCFIRRR